MDARLWRRLGDESQGDDARKGHVGPISEEDLRACLWLHHVNDLDALASDAARDQALDWLVEGYLHGEDGTR